MSPGSPVFSNSVIISNTAENICTFIIISLFLHLYRQGIFLTCPWLETLPVPSWGSSLFPAAYMAAFIYCDIDSEHDWASALFATAETALPLSRSKQCADKSKLKWGKGNVMPQYINADIISRADTASINPHALRHACTSCTSQGILPLMRVPPYEKSRPIHPADDPSGFLYKGFVRVKFVVPYFFCTYLRQSRVTAARMMIPSNMNWRFVSIPRMVSE